MFGRYITTNIYCNCLKFIKTSDFISLQKINFLFLKKNKPKQKSHQLKICETSEKKNQLCLETVSFVLVKQKLLERLLFFSVLFTQIFSFISHLVTEKKCYSSFPLKLQRIQTLVCLQKSLKICFFSPSFGKSSKAFLVYPVALSTFCFELESFNPFVTRFSRFYSKYYQRQFFWHFGRSLKTKTLLEIERNHSFVSVWFQLLIICLTLVLL